MCGIMGFLARNASGQLKMGRTMMAMLEALGRRGPDSAGLALYTPRDDKAQVLRVKLGDHGDFDARAAEVIRRVAAAASIQHAAREGEYLRLVVGYEGAPAD